MGAMAIRAWDKPKNNHAGTVDELGQIREQIKGLEAREKTLVELVKDMGEGEHIGGKCKAVVSVVSTNRLDTTGLKAALPDEMIAKFTVSLQSVRVTIKANL